MPEQTKKQQLEQYLVFRALGSPDFRERLLLFPKETIEAEIGLNFPATLEIIVHEDRLNQLHVVLPMDIETFGELPQADTDLQESSLPSWWKIAYQRA